MNFLVLGCNGMAGHMISLYLKEQGHTVTGFARSQSELVPTIVGDATDAALVSATVRKEEYDAVVNCIGVLNQFAEVDHAKAVYLNSFLPHYLASLTADRKTQIIHISTDCVFSGDKGGYTENDFADGRSFYDRSKALGELNDSKNLTLRQSIIGPDIKASGIGLLNWFLQQSGPVKGYLGAIWTGQTTLQLAKTIEVAAKRRIRGLYNMVPDASICKYDLLKLFNRYIRADEVEIEAFQGVSLDKSLIRTAQGFDYVIPSYEEMVRELGDWMRAHRDLYPHYNL